MSPQPHSGAPVACGRSRGTPGGVRAQLPPPWGWAEGTEGVQRGASQRARGGADGRRRHSLRSGGWGWGERNRARCRSAVGERCFGSVRISTGEKCGAAGETSRRSDRRWEEKMGLGGKQRERCRETARSGAGLGMPEPKCRAVGERAPRPHPRPLRRLCLAVPPPLSQPHSCAAVASHRTASHGAVGTPTRCGAMRGDAVGPSRPPSPPAQTRRRLSAGPRPVGFCVVGLVFFSFAFSFLTQLSSNSQRRRTAVSAPSFSCRVGSFLSCLFSLSSFPPPSPPHKHSSWHHQHRGPPSRGVSIGGRRWPHPTHLHRGLCVLRWGKRTHLAGDVGWQFVLWPSFISRRNSKKE